MHIAVKKLLKDYKSAFILTMKFAHLVECIYGIISPEYIDAKKEFDHNFLIGGDLKIAYQHWLEVHEIAIKLYGSEKNRDVIEILALMIMIKTKLHQFDEARNLILKSKQLEEQKSSKFTEQYKRIINLERILNETEAKLEINNKNFRIKSQDFYRRSLQIHQLNLQFF